MDERLKFIVRLSGRRTDDGALPRVRHRKTGYKILTCYNKVGLEGLTDRSRRPYRHANQLPTQIETLIVRLKEDRPNWGAPKISQVFAGQTVGIKQTEHFGPKVLPMSLERNVTHVSRTDRRILAIPAGFEPATHGVEIRYSIQLSYGTAWGRLIPPNVKI